ncbi:uncharacterized protein LOC128207316 [Mya arenaria]|uniref:uncharacterized protein LOC128207316 n=1 Tax=Mya arenaria TaxID=6604 RepID=UPI0022E6CF33|nr:uncharacterized protein LOC128207316 [Mya arenaria]
MKMESYMELTQSKDNQNWYKTLIGLHITKEGLVDFVIDVMKCFHRRTFDDINRKNGRPIGTVCKMCSKKDLKSPHYVCPNNICVQFYKQLKQAARGREISWSNTDPTKWCTDFWEVAKCFLPPEGYRDANCPQETDFNGIVNLIANCRQFETHFADDLTKASNKCIKARKIANNTRHSSSLQIDDITLQENLDTMKDLLWDSKRLATDPKATSAVTKLTQLENDQLLMTEADIRTVVRITTEGLSDKIEELRSLEKSLIHYMEEVQKNIMQCGIPEHISNVYENKKSGLRNDLHEFNSEMHCTSSISPMIQEKRSKIVDFYVAPSIETISTNRRYSCKGDHISGKGSVSTFREIFNSAKGKSRYVYVSAKAGAGKTAFCQYVAAIWCALQRNDKEEIQTFKKNNKTGHFEDICVLKEYDFLFFVSLREIRDQLCDVDDMIFQQIVTNLSGGHMYDPSLLKEILRNESCLIVIDGLDEWKHPLSCKVQPNNVPHFKVRPNCTCLITSRPWKLSECRLKESDLTVCIEINGIKGVRNDLLTEYVTSCLNSKYGKTKDVAEFRKVMESSFLETPHQDDSIPMGCSIANICSIPVMLMHILCLWYDDVSFGKSKCETYCNMISLLIEMANMDTSVEYNGDFELIGSESLPNCILENKVCTENSTILVGLGRLAFKTLFAESREDTVTFTEDIVSECFMNSEVSIESLLKIGILSRCTITCNASSQPVRYSFLHKSYQEMLCALFVSSLDVTSPEKPSVFKRMEDCLVDLDRIFDMSEIFVFICGMNAELAKLFSEKISDSCSYCLSKNFNEYQNGQMIKALQEMMSSGLEESKNNGFLQTEIIFKHVYLDDSTDNVHLGAIVDFNINRITTLYTKHYGNTQKVIEIINNSHHCLKYMSLSSVTFECQEERVFTYDQLSILSLRDSIINGPLQLCCPHVSTCEIEHVQIQEDVDFSACHQLSVIQLKNVTIGGMLKASSCFHLWSLCLKDVSFSGLIDLSFCSQLSILKVEDVILPGNLDLSSCPQIIRIKLKNVTLKGSIDISSCPKLSALKVKNVNFDGTLCLPARSQLNCLKLENITMNSDLNLFSCVEAVIIEDTKRVTGW